MIKVLLLAPTPPSVGGIANWTGMLLKKFNHSQDVFLKAINVGSNKKESYKMNLFQRVFYGLQDCFEVVKNIKVALREEKFDIIHFTTTGSLSLYRDRKIIKLAKRYNIPIVMHVRNGRFPQIFQKKGLEWRIFKKHFTLVDKIIAIDKNTFECIYKYFPKKTVEILNPIGLNKTQNIKLLHRFNGILTFAGWVVKTKGIEELIEAFCIMKKRYPFLKLQIIGPYDDNYLSHLKNTFDVSGIAFLGPLANQKCLELISESEIFVFPSYTEGCPNVILEAMLCKTPIVASNVGSIPELLDNNCGIIIQKQSVDEIVQKVEFLIENRSLHQSYIENAYNRIINNLSIDNVTNKYFNLWKEATNV